MKITKIPFIAAACCLLVSMNCLAQQQDGGTLKTIDPMPLEITDTKTTNIIFPQAIVGVDRGSRDVWAKKANGVENILQIKAASNKLIETTLTVVTGDGKLNSFLLRYSPDPSVLNVSIGAASRVGTITLAPESINQAEVQAMASSVAISKRKSATIRDRNSGVEIEVDGIFIHDDIMYWRLKIANKSNINYTVEQLRFFIMDQRKAKRTASQELEVSPVFVFNSLDKIAAQKEGTAVFAVPKFTIPDSKILAVQLMEKNGGRHLEIEIKNRHLMNAIPIEISNRP